MAKIHVRGGSPLELQFVDDTGNILEDCQLSLKRTGEWYTVHRTGDKPQVSGPALQAVQEPKNSTIFRSCGDSVRRIEIGYSEKARGVAKVP